MRQSADIANKKVPAAKGAAGVISAADMMQKCDIVITCLPSPAASTAVVSEMLPQMKDGKIWVEMSRMQREW